MKAPIVALAATAAGFAAASAYLYGELSIEPVRTQAEVEARSRHEARSKQLHQAIEIVTGGPAQASVLPFSELKDPRFMAAQGESESAVQQTVVLQQPVGSVQKAVDPKAWDPREERAAASRLSRRLMRERAVIPEPPSH
jgi:hypothetical protein